MKRLKALIKMECKSAWIIGLYFMMINICIFAALQEAIIEIKQDYLLDGIRLAGNYTNIDGIFGQYTGVAIIAVIMYCIGFCLLVGFSFKQDKGHESSRFLKALPYTMQERILVKMGVGLGIYIVNALIWVIGLFVNRMQFFTQFKDILDVTMLGELVYTYFTPEFVGKLCIYFVLLTVAFYLFLILMQYLINPNIGSIVSAIFMFLSPTFIVVSATIYIENSMWLNYISKGLANLYLVIDHWVEYSVELKNGNIGYFNAPFQIGNMTSFMIGWGIIIGAEVAGILVLSKTYLLEKSDLFIGRTGFKLLYKIGVTVCGGLLMGDLYSMCTGNVHQAECYIAFIIGALISYFIVSKITNIGMPKQKKEVAA